MSTDKDFAVSHPGFWRTTLPLSESFVRVMNRSLERLAPPMPSSVAAERRGLVNEGGFRVFASAVAAGKSPTELDAATIASAWALGTAHVRTMRQYGRAPLDSTPRAGELEEAVQLAERTALFFLSQGRSRLLVEPTFIGCGWIGESRGDVLADQTLFEIKAGDRHFRSIDLYQLLTYCALNFATKALDISSVGLMNPRVGTFIVLDLELLCARCAGASAADVLDEVYQYISEPLGLYGH